MPTLRSTHFLKQTILMDSRNTWVYFQRLLIGLSTALLLFIIRFRISDSSGGLFFFYYFAPFLLILLTALAISSCINSISTEKEEGILELILMTGISPFSYIAGRATGKTLQLFYLYLVLIPSTLFAATLGGISPQQIVSIYLYLSFWFFFIIAAATWCAVICSNRKEAFLIAVLLTLGVLLIAAICSASPFGRLNQIMATKNIELTFYSIDMLSYSFLALFFMRSAIRNFEIGTTIPFNFWDDYEERVKIREEKQKREDSSLRLTEEQERFHKKTAISQKDLKNHPKTPILALFYRGSVTFRIIIFVLICIFFLPPFILFTVMWSLPSALINTWNRIITGFSDEVEQKTWESLRLLPLTTEQLMHKKLEGARVYDTVLALFYLVFVLPSLFLFVFPETWLIPFSLLGTLALYHVLIYATILVALKTQQMIKVSSFCLNFFLIILYFTFPIFLVPATIICLKPLKHFCLRELESSAL